MEVSDVRRCCGRDQAEGEKLCPDLVGRGDGVCACSFSGDVSNTIKSTLWLFLHFSFIFCLLK